MTDMTKQETAARWQYESKFGGPPPALYEEPCFSSESVRPITAKIVEMGMQMKSAAIEKNEEMFNKWRSIIGNSIGKLEGNSKLEAHQSLYHIGVMWRDRGSIYNAYSYGFFDMRFVGDGVR